MMRALCDRGGAVFFSTHVLDVAERLCNKIAVIKGGKLIAAGEIEAVFYGNALRVFRDVLA